MAGGGGSQNTTQSTAPWKGQQPYLQQGFQQAQDIYNQGPAQYFPGQTYTDMSSQTKAGLGQQQAIASNPNNVVNSAAQQSQNTINGQYLNPSSNPYLKATYEAGADNLKDDFNDVVLPGIASQFGDSGMTGSTTHGLALGRASEGLTDSLSGLSSSIYGGNYGAERDRQMAAISGAPALRGAQYGDAEQLKNVGSAFEGQQAKQLEDSINRFNYNQNAQLASLQDYMSLISGNYGSTSTSRSSSGGSPLATGLGAAGMLLNMFG